jgi:hypothetical protein
MSIKLASILNKNGVKRKLNGFTLKEEILNKKTLLTTTEKIIIEMRI